MKILRSCSFLLCPGFTDISALGLVGEMVRDILKKHEHVLWENEDLVRLCEEKYRKKHNL